MNDSKLSPIQFLANLARNVYVCDCCGAIYYAITSDHHQFFDANGCNTCSQGKLKKLFEAMQ